MATDRPMANDDASSAQDGRESAADLVWRAVLVVEICLLVAVALGAGIGLLLSDALLTLVERVSGGGS